MVVKKFKFDYKGKKVELEVQECKSVWSQIRGLMFRRKSKPLLFIFNDKKKRAIHSFFCVEFVAVWFNGDKIVDVKIVKPWKVSIKPLEKFNKLLEIPKNSKEFAIFVDDERKV